MAYSVITAFLNRKLTDDDTPKVWAKHCADSWLQMTQENLEAELLPLFSKLKIACDELERTGRLHILEGVENQESDF